MDGTRNAIYAERSKGTEQVKITEQGTGQMEITMNPHRTIVYTEWMPNSEIKDMGD